MRRREWIVCLMLITALLCSACLKQNTVDMKSLMAEIQNEFSLCDLKEVSSPDELKTLFQIDETDIADYAVRYSFESDRKEELILIRAKDADASDRIQTTLFSRLDAFLSGAKSYSPEDFAVLEKCRVAVYNDIYVTLVISEKAQEIDQYIKEKIG